MSLEAPKKTGITREDRKMKRTASESTMASLKLPKKKVGERMVAAVPMFKSEKQKQLWMAAKTRKEEARKAAQTKKEEARKADEILSVIFKRCKSRPTKEDVEKIRVDVFNSAKDIKTAIYRLATRRAKKHRRTSADIAIDRERVADKDKDKDGEKAADKDKDKDGEKAADKDKDKDLSTKKALTKQGATKEAFDKQILEEKAKLTHSLFKCMGQSDDKRTWPDFEWSEMQLRCEKHGEMTYRHDWQRTVDESSLRIFFRDHKTNIKEGIKADIDAYVKKQGEAEREKATAESISSSDPMVAAIKINSAVQKAVKEAKAERQAIIKDIVEKCTGEESIDFAHVAVWNEYNYLSDDLDRQNLPLYHDTLAMVGLAFVFICIICLLVNGVVATSCYLFGKHSKKETHSVAKYEEV